MPNVISQLVYRTEIRAFGQLRPLLSSSPTTAENRSGLSGVLSVRASEPARWSIRWHCPLTASGL